ncbi:TPA: hypothetical protein DIS57_01955 [Candidatus Wolfebacteria bacterium]|nr:hypothetical protein [Candidatus Wolfebacteria bacterium]HAS95362.1 hypothetical protein [Candidatus Wolfebacteria bacterium]HBT74772.1 hypothetical protein [Candidatus Wolfebacteria bacterium]HCM52695.1 hypothetical protein [Candidatus Wolfebacteria bacterium]
MKKTRRNIKKYWYGVVGAMVVLLGGVAHAHAETEFMTNWQTRTYVPAWYEGRAFPTHESAITITFELIEDGKIADLSQTGVRWYVDGKLVKNELNGLGIKRVIIVNKKYGGGVSSIKITIPSYNGKLYEKTFDIPIRKPEVVIDVPYFKKGIERGENAMYAWPFFFNTTDVRTLNLQWTIDGKALDTKKADEAALLFTVGSDIPPGSRSTIEAIIINQRKAIENVRNKVFVEMP